MRECMSVRMAGADVTVTVGVAIRRRLLLRQPRRITDRAERSRNWRNVIADSLQPLQNGLPLLPIQLAQEGAQSLDEGIFEERFAIGFRNKKAVQPDVERFGDFFQSTEARSHLTTLNARQVGARDFRARLQLALGHRARFAQLANALADVLHRFLVNETDGGHFCCCFLHRGWWRNQKWT